MGAENFLHKKSYGPFKGLDYTKNKFNLSSEFQTKMQNVQLSAGPGSLTSRRGFKRGGRANNQTDAGTGFGIYKYDNINSTTGVITEDVLSIDTSSTSKLHKLTDYTFTLSQSGALSFLINFRVNATTGLHEFTITKNGSVIYTKVTDSAAGTSSITVSQLITDINSNVGGAPNNITVALGTASGSEYVSDFLPITIDTAFTGASVTLTGSRWASIPLASTSVTSLFPNYVTHLADANAQLPSSALAQNCFYIATGYDDLIKYDGQYAYKAGLPVAASTFTYVVNPGVSGSIYQTAGYYTYAIAYEQTDAKGNVLEGLGATKVPVQGELGYPAGPYAIRIQSSALGSPTAETALLTVPNIQPSAGYNTRAAVVVGNQNLVASRIINVNGNGVGVDHGLNVGDSFAVLLSPENGVFVQEAGLLEGKIEARTSTTITISENVTFTPGTLVLGTNDSFQVRETTVTALIAAAGVAAFKNGWIVSAGLKINVYRNKGAGLSAAPTSFPDWYLCQVFPNNPYAATQTVEDYRVDVALGPIWAQKAPISQQRFLPSQYNIPQCKYIAFHKDRMYMTGDPTNPNTVYRSDILYGPEYFDPYAANELNVETRRNDIPTGISGVGDSVVIPKSNSVVQITGDLGSDSAVRVQPVNEELQCGPHASLAVVLDSLVIPTTQGPVMVSERGEVTFLGASPDTQKSRLESAFRSSTADLTRATGVANFSEAYYAVFLPTKLATQSGFAQFQISNSTSLATSLGTLYVYDFINDVWANWTNIDASGGFVLKGGAVMWTRAGYTGTSYTGALFIQNNTKTLYDYCDWTAGIDWQLGLNWETLGDDAVNKLFRKAEIYSMEQNPVASNNMQLSASFERNFVEGTTFSSFDLALDGATTLRDQGKIKTEKVRAIRMLLASSTIFTCPTITGILLEASAPFKPKADRL